MGSGRFPDFIGIGAAKSGTTWLARNLGQHPDVFVPPRKEVSSFAYHDFDSACIESYKKYFHSSPEFKVKGEFSTIYLQSKHAPSRIHELLPDVKLIVSLRNPIEQINSHYWHLRRQNFHQDARDSSSVGIEQAITEYPELLIEPARYFKHLSRWKKFFAPDQILVVFFDDIVKSPEWVLRTTWSFLGLDCEEWLQRPGEDFAAIERQGVSPRGEQFEALHSALYGALVRRIYNPLKRVVGPRHAAAVKDGLRLRRMMESIFFRKGYPDMPPDVRTRLRDELAGEIEGLSRMTGRDLSAWVEPHRA
jgi:hypothetical protein